VEHKAKTSATVIYDGKSKNDRFRIIDEIFLIGLMDMKGDPSPTFLYLREMKELP